MTSKHSPGPRRAVPPALDDHVRIVPLWVPKELVAPAPGIKAPPGTALTYRGGPLLAAVEVFTAYWGQAWNTTAQQSVITTLNDFFRFIVASPYVDQLGEYDAPPYKIGRGRWVGTTTVTSPEPEPNVTDTTIRQMLQQQLSVKTTFPAAGPNMVYFVFLPPGVSVVAGGTARLKTLRVLGDPVALAKSVEALGRQP